MKIYKTNYKNLRRVNGVSFYDKRGYFREIFKEKYLKKK